jgi:hypothetical protein
MAVLLLNTLNNVLFALLSLRRSIACHAIDGIEGKLHQSGTRSCTHEK